MTIKLGGFELALYPREFYLKVPRLFECVWNPLGFCANRL